MAASVGAGGEDGARRWCRPPSDVRGVGCGGAGAAAAAAALGAALGAATFLRSASRRFCAFSRLESGLAGESGIQPGFAGEDGPCLGAVRFWEPFFADNGRSMAVRCERDRQLRC